MDPSLLPLIDVERLQIGVFVSLDVGWRNHPFLRSSFNIRTPEQLKQLQSFGPRQVRYCPRRSEAPPLPAATVSARASEVRIDVPEAVAPTTRASWEPIELPTEDQWDSLSLKQVEDEYLQLAQQHQQFTRQVLTDPVAARRSAEQIGNTLYAAVAEADIPALRLLSQRVAPQASGHEVAVAALATLLARDCGFGEQALREVALASLLHDIGKLRIPTFLHEDHGQLSEFEQQSYRQHVALGVELAGAMGLAPGITRAIAQHHEHVDGTGFPAGLREADMTPAGRILAIANRYMNLTCPARPEAGLTPHQALQQMYRNERARFDNAYLARFVRVLGIYPPGTLVELSDARRAIVVAARPGNSLAPRVQVVEQPDAEASGPLLDIEINGEIRVKRSLNPEQLSAPWAQWLRQIARTPVYVESQTSPEWSSWAGTQVEQTPV